MRWFWSFIALLVAAAIWWLLASEPTRSSGADPINAAEPTMGASVTTMPDGAGGTDGGSEDRNSANADGGNDPLGELLGGAPGGNGFLGLAAPRKDPVAVDTRAPSEVVRRVDERTIMLDERFRITGNGSANDPYRISWELLTSAGAFIDPAQGALRAPPWVRLLDGTYIELSGYYSTAIRVPVATHLLLTLNRWDGCCIGLPPTPFDAIDLSMRIPLPMAGLHAIRFGTFRGRLSVEPFEAGGFLLGLYRLEDTTFETK